MLIALILCLLIFNGPCTLPMVHGLPWLSLEIGKHSCMGLAELFLVRHNIKYLLKTCIFLFSVSYSKQVSLFSFI